VTKHRLSFLALLAGLLFGVGLAVSGMTLPRKVLAFLDVTGAWDPSLLFVMGGAVAVHFCGYRLVRGRAAPPLAERFVLPLARPIDARLCIGSVLFGVGWGIAGYCPGPALVSLASGQPSPLVFVIAMLAGMWLARPLLARNVASEPEGRGAADTG
jgi:uncharacterized membrane protein YedE/YeeE